VTLLSIRRWLLWFRHTGLPAVLPALILLSFQVVFVRHGQSLNARTFFSRLTPLNFFAALDFWAGFLTAMNSPDLLLRLVQAVAPPSFVLTRDRYLTAPLRALSPDWLFYGHRPPQ